MADVALVLPHARPPVGQSSIPLPVTSGGATHNWVRTQPTTEPEKSSSTPVCLSVYLAIYLIYLMIASWHGIYEHGLPCYCANLFGEKIEIKEHFMASVFSILKSGKEEGANETHKMGLAPVPSGLLLT